MARSTARFCPSQATLGHCRGSVDRDDAVDEGATVDRGHRAEPGGPPSRPRSSDSVTPTWAWTNRGA
jgi:hypothetical protein